MKPWSGPPICCILVRTAPTMAPFPGSQMPSRRHAWKSRLQGTAARRGNVPSPWSCSYSSRCRRRERRCLHAMAAQEQPNNSVSEGVNLTTVAHCKQRQAQSLSVFLTTLWLLHGPAEAIFPAVLPSHRPDGLPQRRTVESECVGPEPLGQYLVYLLGPVEISRLVEREFVVYLNEQKLSSRETFLKFVQGRNQ